MPEPIRPMVTYDLACCYALVGEKEKAVVAVVKAIDGGFDNYDHVKKDEDLKSVIDDERIADAFKRNEPMRAEIVRVGGQGTFGQSFRFGPIGRWKIEGNFSPESKRLG